MKKAKGALALAALAASASQAYAVLSYTSTERSISVDVNSGASSDSKSSSSTGDFAEQVSATNSVSTSAGANQFTSIQPLYIGGEGHAQIFASGPTPATGDSFLDVSFDLAIPHSYTIEGFQTVSGYVSEFTSAGGTATTFFTLTGPGTSVDVQAPSDSFLPLASAGVLQPGSYHLSVRATSIVEDLDGSSTIHSHWDFEMRFVELPPGVPEPLTPTLLAMAGVSLLQRRRWGRGRGA